MRTVFKNQRLEVLKTMDEGKQTKEGEKLKTVVLHWELGSRIFTESVKVGKKIDSHVTAEISMGGRKKDGMYYEIVEII